LEAHIHGLSNKPDHDANQILLILTRSIIMHLEFRHWIYIIRDVTVLFWLMITTYSPKCPRHSL